MLSDFHKYVQLARRTSVKTEERAIKSIGEHNEILNAIKAKDAEKAGNLATIHIMHVMENLHIEEIIAKKETKLKWSKIQMTTPIVEMDGDEMTRILWRMIKDDLLRAVSSILRQIIMILDWNTAMRQMTKLQLIRLMRQRSTK